MTRFYFVRHGESEGNLKKYFQGQLDMPLSPLGIKQAELTAEHFKSIDIDFIYSSDLKRAMYTAELIGKQKGIEATPDMSLREIYAGDWQGVEFEKLASSDEAYSVWLNDIGNAQCPGGESVAEMQSRISNRIHELATLHKGKSVLIVTHGGPIRAMSCLWKAIPVSKMKTVPWVSNSSVTTVDYTDDMSTKIRELGFNKHLGSLVTAFGKNV